MRACFSALVVLATLTAALPAQVQLRPLPGERAAANRTLVVPPPRAQPVPPRAVPVAASVPLRQTGGADGTTATLRIGDTFEMRLSGMESPYGDEFARQYLIDPDGTVNFPYIDAVRAAGYSPGELERIIQQKLVARRIFTSPTVNITMQTTARTVTVTGGVRAPNRLAWTPDLTLRTAIDLCGGLGEFPSYKGLRHIRNGKVLGTYDYRKLQKDPSTDPKVLPGDQVDVPSP